MTQPTPAPTTRARSEALKIVADPDPDPRPWTSVYVRDSTCRKEYLTIVHEGDDTSAFKCELCRRKATE